MPSHLAVLEARWEGRGNYGVRQLFELISAVTTYNPHAHRHDMFSDKTSLKTVLGQIGRSPRFEVVYIGSHGTSSGLKNGIKFSEVIEAFRDCNNNGHIRGLYLGVCSLAKPQNIRKLLDPGSRTNLQWVAGYSKDIHWLESAAADLLFWSGYLHSNAAAPLAQALVGTKNLLKFMPEAEQRLGFSASKWSRNRRQVESLLPKL